MFDNQSHIQEQTLSENSIFSSILQRLFATAKFDNEGSNLKKVLNLYHLIFLGISCTIGCGAYTIIGLAAQESGPSISISFACVGFLCFFTCFPYAEFSARIHSAGFSYSYIYSTCGEFLAYLAGHSLTLINIMSAAFGARCWSFYIASTLGMAGIQIPLWLYNWDVCGVQICILGAVIVVIFSLLMLFGIEDSATVNNVIAALNVLTLIFALIAGLISVNPVNYETFFPFGVKGMFTGMGLSFFAFLGFEYVTCFGEEAKNPERDVPIAIIVVLTFTTILYSLISLVMTGMQPLSVMNTNDSMLATFKKSAPFWICIIISAGSIIGLTSSVYMSLLCQPRVFFSIASDGLLPRFFMTLNQKTKAPTNAIFVTCISAVFFTLFFEVALIGNTVSLAALIISAIVDLSVVIARFEEGSILSTKISKSSFLFAILSIVCGRALYNGWPAEIITALVVCLGFLYLYIQAQPQEVCLSSFPCPGFPFIPLAGAFFFFCMASIIEYQAWKIYAAYMLIGAFSYFMYGFQKSNLNQKTKENCELLGKALLELEFSDPSKKGDINTSDHILDDEEICA